nr:hypothetical protein [Tanacetum cinerariifolium]
MDAGEVSEMDPYEEVAQQGQAAPPSSAYVPDLMELKHHTDPFKTDESAARPPLPLAYPTGIRLRAASPLSSPTSPPTHHLLPLPAPSTSRIANFLEADILPRKRLLLTTPTPRFEVGENSAAAARQSGYTVARRVDYSFVDIVDASILALEGRTMAAIEVVNLRISYHADVRRREIEEFYTRHQDAQRDRAALCDQMDTLRRYLSSLYTTHKQERVEARLALARSEAHNSTLEARIAVLKTQAYHHECQQVARLLALPTPPPSPLTLLSSSLPQIPSLPLPVPSPPTTSPTYAEEPLGYKATGIRLRAASPLSSPTSPPTHHLLPLPAPSTSRIADFLEADIPPRKRLLLTTPIPRFEVGENSAAAARQPGYTVARRVDYNFVDTVDASIRALEGRTMAAIEVVNLRISYQADVRRREIEEFYTRHQDAQRDRAALCDQMNTLRRYLSSLYTTYEQERVEARLALARSEAHNSALEKMPPKRNAVTTITTPMTDAQIKALIIKELLMPWQNMTQAEAGMAMTTMIQGVTEEDKCLLLELALLYGRMFPKEFDKVEKYVSGLLDMIQGSVMASKPKKMHDAIEFTTELMDQKISRAYTARTGEKKPYGGCKPLCPKCNYHHEGPYVLWCKNCKKIGHLARDCRGAAIHTNTQRGVTCFECGVQRHYKKDCPKLRNKNQGNQAGNGNVVARAYAVGTAGTNPILLSVGARDDV